jgi:hypothetical protein
VAVLLYFMLCGLSGSPDAIVDDSTHAQASIRSQQPMREWTDANGRRRVRAALLRADIDKLWLRRADGRLASTMLNQLSASDRQYVMSYLWDRAAGQPSRSKLSLFSHSIFQKLLDRITAPNRVAERLARPKPAQANRPVPGALVYVRVSRGFINDYVQRSVHRRGEVKDTILGTQIFGESETNGETHFILSPNPNKLTGAIAFEGTVHSRTIGYNGPAIIHSISDATFRARKPIGLDSSGLNAAPVTASASTNLHTTNIETTLPRLRGRIARRIAWRRANESRREFEAISSRHTADRIGKELDRQVDQSLEKVQQVVQSTIEGLKIGDHRLVSHTNFRTMPEYIELAMIRQGASDEEKRFLPPPVEGAPDVAIRVNRALLGRALTDPEIGAKLVPLLAKFLEARASEKTLAVVYRPEDQQADITNWKIGQDWLTLEFTDPKREPQSHRIRYR